jgi:hypothetical protein
MCINPLVLLTPLAGFLLQDTFQMFKQRLNGSRFIPAGFNRFRLTHGFLFH